MPANSVGDRGALPQGKRRYGKLDLLSSYWRLGRIRYLAYSYAFLVVAVLSTWGISWLLPLLPLSFRALVAGFLYTVVWGGFLYLFSILSIKRCHDFDVSGWWALLLLLFPPAIVLLWVMPGTDGVNRYGRDMPPNSLSEKLLALLALVFFLSVGVLWLE